MLWGVDILEILAASLLEGSTVYDPSFTTKYVRLKTEYRKCVESLLV